MTPWTSARRADEFESRVSGAPATDPGTGRDDELLALVAQLQGVPAPAPRPEFLADLRSRLMAEAADVLVVTDPAEQALAARLVLPERNPRRQRRLAAALTSLVLVGTGGTMAFASQSALPGDSLYPVKRFVERAESRATFSDASRGSQMLDHAQARLDEARDLLDNGSTDRVPGALASFTSQSTGAAAVLFADHEARRDPDVVRSVRDFAARNLLVLDEMAADAPTRLRPAIVTAAEALVALDERAARVCSLCEGGIDTLPGLLAAPTPAVPTPLVTAPPVLPGTTPDPVTGRGRAKPSAGPTSAAPAPVPGAAEPTPGSKPEETAAPTASAKPGPATSKGPSPSASSSAPGLVGGLLGTTGENGESTPGVVGEVVGGVTGTVGGVLGGVVGAVGGLLGGGGKPQPTPPSTPAP